MGVFSDLEGADFKAFSSAANELREDATFGHTFDGSILDERMEESPFILQLHPLRVARIIHLSINVWMGHPSSYNCTHCVLHVPYTSR
jgi:hypothetical protein